VLHDPPTCCLRYIIVNSNGLLSWRNFKWSSECRSTTTGAYGVTADDVKADHCGSSRSAGRLSCGVGYRDERAKLLVSSHFKWLHQLPDAPCARLHVRMRKRGYHTRDNKTFCVLVPAENDTVVTQRRVKYRCVIWYNALVYCRRLVAWAIFFCEIHKMIKRS